MTTPVEQHMMQQTDDAVSKVVKAVAASLIDCPPTLRPTVSIQIAHELLVVASCLIAKNPTPGWKTPETIAVFELLLESMKSIVESPAAMMNKLTTGLEKLGIESYALNRPK